MVLIGSRAVSDFSALQRNVDSRDDFVHGYVPVVVAIPRTVGNQRYLDAAFVADDVRVRCSANAKRSDAVVPEWV